MIIRTIIIPNDSGCEFPVCEHSYSDTIPSQSLKHFELL
jgi:hypothetical protein